MRDDLDLALEQTVCKTWHSLFHFIINRVIVERARCDPHAELIVFKSISKIGDKDVEKVFLCPIKLAEVCAPGDVSDYVDACFSQYNTCQAGKEFIDNYKPLYIVTVKQYLIKTCRSISLRG
jgi:hypothetical protein